jgi:hypothetical protein
MPSREAIRQDKLGRLHNKPNLSILPCFPQVHLTHWPITAMMR